MNVSSWLLACTQLAWRAREELTSVCIQPCRHALIRLSSCLLNIFLFGHPLMEVFSWQLLETVQLSILLFSCTAQSQNIVVFTITSKNREYKHKWLRSIKEQQIKYICKMFLFLIIAGAIYNIDFISYVGVWNDLLFWHILFKKTHSSVLTNKILNWSKIYETWKYPWNGCSHRKTNHPHFICINVQPSSE